MKRSFSILSAAAALLLVACGLTSPAVATRNLIRGPDCRSKYTSALDSHI
jgi:hypothetical protein